jgi:hypothetical protein
LSGEDLPDDFGFVDHCITKNSIEDT